MKGSEGADRFHPQRKMIARMETESGVRLLGLDEFNKLRLKDRVAALLGNPLRFFRAGEAVEQRAALAALGTLRTPSGFPATPSVPPTA